MIQIEILDQGLGCLVENLAAVNAEVVVMPPFPPWLHDTPLAPMLTKQYTNMMNLKLHFIWIKR